jgi:hypothetical protein
MAGQWIARYDAEQESGAPPTHSTALKVIYQYSPARDAVHFGQDEDCSIWWKVMERQVARHEVETLIRIREFGRIRGLKRNTAPASQMPVRKLQDFLADVRRGDMQIERTRSRPGGECKRDVAGTGSDIEQRGIRPACRLDVMGEKVQRDPRSTEVAIHAAYFRHTQRQVRGMLMWRVQQFCMIVPQWNREAHASEPLAQCATVV